MSRDTPIYWVRHQSRKDVPNRDRLEAIRTVLFRSLAVDGRLPVGWSWPGYDLRQGRDAWIRLRSGDPGAKGGGQADWDNVHQAAEIPGGAIVLAPSLPGDGAVTFAVTRGSPSASAYDFDADRPLAPDDEDDFCAFIRVRPESVVVVRRGDGLLPELFWKKVGRWRGAVRQVQDGPAIELIRDLISSGRGRSKGHRRGARGHFTNWSDLLTEDYFADSPEGRGRRRRRESKFVNWVAQRFLERGLSPGRVHPVDLVLDRPQLVFFEAKRSASVLAVRAAVAQLLWYSWMLRERGKPLLCVLVPSRPAADLVAFVERHAKLCIAWRQGDELVGGARTARALGPAGVIRAD